MNSYTKCELCQYYKAQIDGKTKKGLWALMCMLCHKEHGLGIGIGKGQFLYKKDKE